VFKEPTLIIQQPSQSTNDFILNCCYNPLADQYLVAWSGITSSGEKDNAYYCLIASSGEILQEPTTIPGSYYSYKAIAPCYNSLNNTFFLTWFNVNSDTFFATIDAQGRVLTPSTQILDFKSSIFGNIYCSFNPINNSILISTASKNLYKSTYCRES